MRRRDDIASRDLDGEVIGLDLRTGRYFSLNSSAAVLWDLLDRDVEPDQLVQALIAEYGLGAEEAREDVEAFLASLREDGLLLE